jgi:NAD-dependent histone deacetylase SIR2
MHCTVCAESVPSADHYPLPDEPVACPECKKEASIRSALSERQRRVGTLRASVVLYGEEHPQGEAIGTVMERDLRGTGPRGEREGRADLLIVAGTSLSIPGVKRIVKEMAKSLATRTEASVRDGREPPVRAVYVNAEPPAKPGEWDGVFDVWAQGDVQDLVALVADSSYAPPLPKTPRRTKKVAGLPTPSTTGVGSTSRKRKAGDDPDDTPTKKRGSLPLTPASTPPRKGQRGSSSLPSASPHRSASPSPPPRPAFTESTQRSKAEKDAPIKKEETPKRRKDEAKPRKRAKFAPEDGTPTKAQRPKAELPSPPAPPYKKYEGVARFSPPPPLNDLYGLYGKVGGAERCAVPR